MPALETPQQRRTQKAPEIVKRRFSLNLGNGCNCDCQFCFQKTTKLNQPRMHDLTFHEAVHCISQLKDGGIDTIEFTGGEPTLRPDLALIVTHARQVGIRHICVATNGIQLSEWKVVNELKNAGVDEFRFLLQGHNASIHDKMTQTSGCFNRVIQAIQYCRRLGLKLQINTVVTGLNYNFLIPLMERVLQLHLNRVNFICLNPAFTTPLNQDSMNILYSLIAPKFQEIADRFWKVMKKITFTFIPFCFMVGYEQYVNNGRQIIYDPDETDALAENHVQFALWHSAMRNQLNLSFLSSYQKAFQIDWQRFCRAEVQKFFEVKYKVKPKKCHQCRYDLICDGLWRNYVKWVGFREIQPVPGEKIENPTHFMRVTKQ